MRTFPVLLVCLWLGIVSFGGGLAVVPEMHRQFVEASGWLTSAEFADGYALAQLSPGPNMLCIVFYVYRSAGIAAALVAPVLVIAPGVVLSAWFGHAWQMLATNVWIVRFRCGLVPVGLGLMAGGVFVVGRSTLTSWPLAILSGVIAVAVHSRRVHPAIAVLAAGAAGFAANL